MFKLLFKNKKQESTTLSLTLKNNDLVIINGKKYIVGEHYFDKDLTLHCIE